MCCGLEATNERPGLFSCIIHMSGAYTHMIVSRLSCRVRRQPLLCRCCGDWKLPEACRENKAPLSLLLLQRSIDINFPVFFLLVVVVVVVVVVVFPQPQSKAVSRTVSETGSISNSSACWSLEICKAGCHQRGGGRDVCVCFMYFSVMMSTTEVTVSKRKMMVV